LSFFALTLERGILTQPFQSFILHRFQAKGRFSALFAGLIRMTQEENLGNVLAQNLSQSGGRAGEIESGTVSNAKKEQPQMTRITPGLTNNRNSFLSLRASCGICVANCQLAFRS
jgi:hypothetical protein